MEWKHREAVKKNRQVEELFQTELVYSGIIFLQHLNKQMLWNKSQIIFICFYLYVRTIVCARSFIYYIYECIHAIYAFLLSFYAVHASIVLFIHLICVLVCNLCNNISFCFIYNIFTVSSH